MCCVMGLVRSCRIGLCSISAPFLPFCFNFIGVLRLLFLCGQFDALLYLFLFFIQLGGAVIPCSTSAGLSFYSLGSGSCCSGTVARSSVPVVVHLWP